MNKRVFLYVLMGQMKRGAEICVLPIDAMAHARDESGQEHERLPVWRFFTCDTAHVTVGPAITLRHRHHQVLFRAIHKLGFR